MTWVLQSRHKGELDSMYRIGIAAIAWTLLLSTAQTQAAVEDIDPCVIVVDAHAGKLDHPVISICAPEWAPGTEGKHLAWPTIDHNHPWVVGKIRREVYENEGGACLIKARATAVGRLADVALKKSSGNMRQDSLCFQVTRDGRVLPARLAGKAIDREIGIVLDWGPFHPAEVRPNLVDAQCNDSESPSKKAAVPSNIGAFLRVVQAAIKDGSFFSTCFYSSQSLKERFGATTVEFLRGTKSEWQESVRRPAARDHLDWGLEFEVKANTAGQYVSKATILIKVPLDSPPLSLRKTESLWGSDGALGTDRLTDGGYLTELRFDYSNNDQRTHITFKYDSGGSQLFAIFIEVARNER